MNHLALTHAAIHDEGQPFVSLEFLTALLCEQANLLDSEHAIVTYNAID
jgi:hypothetical protein